MIRRYYLKKLMQGEVRCAGKTFLRKYYLIRYIAGWKWFFMSKKEKQKLAERIYDL